MLDEVQNLSIDGVESLGQVFLPPHGHMSVNLAPEPVWRGMPLVSNCVDLI